MTTLEKVRELLPEMTFEEKTQILQWITYDLSGKFPGIERTPGVAGGVPCIVRTRIPVWLLVQAHRLGSNDADIIRAYPSLRPEDLANAWAYYGAHKQEIEQQIIENEMA
jgi:uncharacterized protein (DUF433 family)